MIELRKLINKNLFPFLMQDRQITTKFVIRLDKGGLAYNGNQRDNFRGGDQSI